MMGLACEWTERLPCLCGDRLLLLRGRGYPVATQLQKPDDYLVLVLRELIDRSPGGLARNTVNDGLLELGRDVRSAEGLHEPGERVHEVLHEVIDAARAAPEV